MPFAPPDVFGLSDPANRRDWLWLQGVLGDAWKEWTPTFVGFTDTSATTNCRFWRVGNTVHASVSVLLGSSFAASSTFGVSLPFDASTGGVGVASYTHAGSKVWSGSCSVAATSSALVFNHDSSSTGLVDGTHPFTFVTGDSLSAALWFQATV